MSFTYGMGTRTEKVPPISQLVLYSPIYAFIHYHNNGHFSCFQAHLGAGLPVSQNTLAPCIITGVA